MESANSFLKIVVPENLLLSQMVMIPPEAPIVGMKSKLCRWFGQIERRKAEPMTSLLDSWIQTTVYHTYFSFQP
jgi:hypothetical protein